MANLTSNAIARANDYCAKGFPCKTCGDKVNGVDLINMINTISRMVDADMTGSFARVQDRFINGKYVPGRQTLAHGDGIVHTDDLFKYTPRLTHEDFHQSCPSMPATLTVTHVGVTCPYCGNVNQGLPLSAFKRKQQGMCSGPGGCRRVFSIPPYGPSSVVTPANA